MAVKAPVGRTEEVMTLVEQAVDGFGRIDVVVNNAATNPHFGPLLTADESQLDKILDTNAKSVFRVCKAVVPQMEKQGGGKIINIASVAGLRGTAPGVHTIAYNTSKAAMINFTRALASEWGRYNINVNAICPGFFPTKMSEGLLERIGEAVIARAPLHRLGGAEDLKGAVVFFASEASRHVTGQYLAVDGGASIV